MHKMKQLFVFFPFLLSYTIVRASARKSILLAREHQTVPKLRHSSCAVRDESWISLNSPDLFLGFRTVACWSSWVERQRFVNESGVLLAQRGSPVPQGKQLHEDGCSRQMRAGKRNRVW